MSTGDSNDQRSLADDPGFMASLSQLDDGLGGAGSAPARRAKTPARGAASPPSVILPPVVTVPGRRPLLDLFPTADGPEADAPAAGERGGLAPGTIAPPRVAARPLQAERVPSSPAATYETFYGLSERPFSLSTDPKFLYQSTEYDRVVQQMLGAIGRREPIVVLTGELGVGKTMLCRAVIEQLDRRTLTSVVTEPFDSLDDLLKRLLIDFGVVSSDDVARGRLASATQGELAAALREFLESLAALQAFAVVIIDEAQQLAADVLHELRHLTSGDTVLIELVLVGQPSLTQAINKPAGNPMSLAVSLRLTLDVLADDEVGGYVMHRLRVAGTHPRVEFDDAAFTRLYEISGGRPRLINLLCERALTKGFADSASVISPELVEEAAEELDMASPASGGGVFASASNVIMLALLTLVGAAAGALAFHSDVAALLARLR